MRRKVFISHSGKDKEGYVDILYKKLKKSIIGNDNIIYDSESFLAGGFIDEEIKSHLDQTVLFVLLISHNSISSRWVLDEIKYAYEYLRDNPIQILPLIIDDSIKHSDSRIPEWLKDYNLRLVKKTTKAESIIVQRYGEIIWNNHPNIKLREAVFVGRNDEMEEFENRVDSYEFDTPSFLIASGLDGIGRKSFIKAALKKIDKIKPTYQFPKVVLDRYQSIEDFISELIDYEYIDEKYKLNLGDKSIAEKVEILLEGIQNIQNQKDIIQIIDSGAIVTPQGILVDWFKLFCEKAKEAFPGLGIIFNIISKYKVRYHQTNNLMNIYSINIDELSINDRKKLLNRWKDIEGIELNRSELDTISSRLTGFPDEVYQIMRLIKEEGISYLEHHLDIISEITSDRIGLVMKTFNDDELALDILSLIAKFDFIAFSTLSKLEPERLKYIDTFLALGICSYIGKSSEYLIMNTGFRIYINRLKRSMRLEFEEALRCFTKENLTDLDELDWASRQFIMQENLLNEDIPEKYLIPSIYLKTIKTLYDNRKPEDLLISLADKILESTIYLDSNILNEVRFFLCSALARKKDSSRFHKEIKFFEGYKREFLFGFYYRHMGQYDKAIEAFKRTLIMEPNFNSAKRELVLSYTKMERYEEGAELALENYNNNKSNPYHIHAYYKVLFHQNLPFQDKHQKMLSLLKNMEKIKSVKAKNMYWTMKGEIALYFTHDYDGAMEASVELNSIDPDNIYVLIYNRDFYFKYNMITELENVLQKLERYNDNNNTYFLDYIKCKIYVYVLKNEISFAKETMKILKEPKLRENIVNKINDVCPAIDFYL